MFKRRKMSRGKSRRNFTKNAVKTHRKNGSGSQYVMRGGIRL